ncbi:UV DNA damage repair endonuclease UvsE [Halobacteriales archaeon QS_3_64_16]|nr:MAG: UV DNA damage repair endonuclease UvsE [Halobacteriales archaeon QS_3_64_16]
MTRLGYAAMNRTVREEDVRMNRGMRKATFEDRGLSYAGELALSNCRGLCRVLRWNVANDVDFLRVPSNLLPWFSRYEIEELPNCEAVRETLVEAGSIAREHGIRVTFHPDHFVKLASPKPDVVARSKTDLENHGTLCDVMGLDCSPYNSINVHIGAHYDDKDATARRFCENFQALSASVRSRLTVENDDTHSLWSVPELVEEVHSEIGIPVVYDELHHQFTDRGLTREEALTRATATWADSEACPVVHYSESRRLHESDPSLRPQAHSDYVAGPIRTWESGADVMVEAKAKERALLAYRRGEGLGSLGSC